MAQTGYTPISLYYSSTASAAPTSGNLVAGELAINTADGKLFYKDSAGVVQTIASKATGSVAGSTTQVIYNNSGAYAGSANLTFDGTTLTANALKSATLSSPAATALSLQSAGTTAITVDASQNVGIGTTSPSVKLHVSNGFIRSSNTANTVRTEIQSDGIYSTGTDLYISAPSTYANIFYAGGSERMRIISGGSAYFSMASFAGGPSSTNAGFAIENNGNSPFINHAQSGTGLTTYYAFINANGAVGTIKTTGSSTQFNTSSDARLKENVVDAPSALDSIKQIGIKSFDWKSDNLHQDYGVVAQDLDLIAPEAVSRGQTNEEMWGVDYSKLVPRIIKAIQEQQVMIEELKTKITALETV